MSRAASAMRRPALAFAFGGLVVAACLGRAQGFEDFGSHWTAQLDDRTGSVAAISVIDAVEPSPVLPSDGVAVRNVAADVIEVSWLGGPCLETARFSLAPGRGDELDLRYEIGAPCDTPVTEGYGFVIRFGHPVEARSVTTVPSWAP